MFRTYAKSYCRRSLSVTNHCVLLPLTVRTNKRRCPVADFENRCSACSVFICFDHCAHVHEPDGLFSLLQLA